MPVNIKELQVKASGPGDGASDIFISITTKRAGKIKGEATTAGHVDEIIVHSLNWGLSANTGIGSSQATARRQYKHLTFTKHVDAATTPLMSAVATNDEVKEAKLMMRKAGGDALEYFTMTLSNARVIGVDIDVDNNGTPIERITITYTKIEIEYQRQQAAGLSSGSTTFTDEWDNTN